LKTYSNVSQKLAGHVALMCYRLDKYWCIKCW